MNIQQLTAWFIAKPIWAALLFFVPLLLILDLLFFEWPKGLNDVLIEAHGVIFDLLVFGIILGMYERRQKQREEEERGKNEKLQRILRYSNELNDLRGMESEEGVRKVVGNIKRLNDEGVSFIILNRHFLEGADLYGVKLMGAILSDAKLKGAILYDSDLTNAYLYNADLTDVRLRGANLAGADLTLADVSIEDLSLSSSLYKTKGIPEDWLIRLKEQKPELFEKPKDYTETYL